jgi:hypothetical protein
MTPEEIAVRMLKRRDLVEKEFKKTVHGLAVSAWATSKQEISKIYAIPEDRTAQGEARFQQFLERRRSGEIVAGTVFRARRGDRKWVRTGHLRRSERVEERSAYEFALVNDAAYSEPRHEAGKPGRRKINPLRQNHWRDETRKVMDPLVQESFRMTLLAILKAGKI